MASVGGRSLGVTIDSERKSVGLVIGIAIPVSSVATFLALGIGGRSLNVISLAGMAFAVAVIRLQ